MRRWRKKSSSTKRRPYSSPSPPSSPSARVSPLRRRSPNAPSSPVSPPSAPLPLSREHPLRSFPGLVLDFCALQVSRIPPRDLLYFQTLLTAEGIRSARMDPQSTPPSIYNMTLQLRTPNDMHRFVCLLPGRMQAVVRQ